MIRQTFTTLLLILPLSAGAQTIDNIQIDRSEVPATIRETAAHIAPDAFFMEFGYEIELIDGAKRRVFELGTRDADGLHLEIDILDDGSLQEIEWETPLEDVQMPVRVEFSLQYPGGKILFVERSIRPNGHTVYEIEGTDADGSRVDLEVMDNGRALIVLTNDITPTG